MGSYPLVALPCCHHQNSKCHHRNKDLNHLPHLALFSQESACVKRNKIIHEERALEICVDSLISPEIPLIKCCSTSNSTRIEANTRSPLWNLPLPTLSSESMETKSQQPLTYSSSAKLEAVGRDHNSEDSLAQW